MRRNKDGASASAGDWSATGTFLRKPPTGWLHEDSELTSGSYIDYEVNYLGCIEVKQSMRTLQFSVRTQVTKEAILRLAETAQRVFMGHKKRKVPKQITKILGEPDVRTTGDMNLSVSVEALKISATTGNIILNHSLPSISFASGGDGPTSDFIGYVAKDPVHNRACHVFECPNSSQYVLATIGQAFELRYKIYLKSPRSNAQPMSVSDSIQSGDAWNRHGGSRQTVRDEETVTTPPALPTPPPPTYEGIDENDAGIYSDIPDLPAAPLSTRNYSNLSTFPPDLETVSYGPSSGGCIPVGVASSRGGTSVGVVSSGESPSVGVVTRLGNPYDTMPAELPNDQIYSDPGEVTSSSPQPPLNDDYEERYTTRPLISIRQSVFTSSEPDQIDLTPSRDYTNIGPDGQVDSETKPYPPKPPRPPYTAARLTAREAQGATGSTRDNRPTKFNKPHILPKPSIRKTSTEDDAVYDDPDVLDKPRSSTRPGNYDDVTEVMRHGLVLNAVANGNNEENVYDDVDHGDESSARNKPPRLPKFDDTIYNQIPGQLSGTSSLAPLPRQQYYHSAISRVEAEALLTRDGEFLVRESSKKPGQYVLTGMAGGKVQHLLLMDKQGKVKSKDREFESIPDLVRYFQEKQSALVIGDSQVFLKTPVINAFLS